MATPIQLVLLPNAGVTVLNTALVDGGSSDNCGIDSLYLNRSTFTCSDIGNSTVRMYVRDRAGNLDSCTAQVQVVDAAAPVLNCPVTRTVNANPSCTAQVPGLTMNPEPNPADLGEGEYFDNAIGCQPFVRQYSLSGATSLGFTPIAGLNTQSFNLGATTVTIRVTDPSGNVGTCVFGITVEDKTGPQWTGVGQAPNSIIQQSANMNGCFANVTWTPPTFTDVCTPPVSVTSSHNPGAPFSFGASTVTYTASDAAGNTSIHSFTVNIADLQPPVARCRNINVSLDAAGTVVVDASQIDGGSTDNCFFNYQTPAYTFGCINLGPNVVTLTVVDGSGNQSTCTATVTVEDPVPPTANCATPGPALLESDGTVTVLASAYNNGSTDNCGPLTYLISVNFGPFAPSYTFDCDDIGVDTITLRAVDPSGNNASCTITQSVLDGLAPTFTVPADITIACGPVFPSITGVPTNVDDNCSTPAQIIIGSRDNIITTPSGSCGNQTITRTWTVTDASGNLAIQTQTITIRDDVAPVFSMPAVINTATDNPNLCTGPHTAQVTASDVSDNCTPFIGMTLSYQVTYPAGSGFANIPLTGGSTVPSNRFPTGTTVVTWRATDACGNTATFTQQVVVADTQGPVFQGLFSGRCGQTYNLVNTTNNCVALFSWNRPASAEVNDCSSPNITVAESISDPSIQSNLAVSNPFVWTSPNTFVSALFPIGSTVVSYLATDADGNTSVCSFTVVVTDNEAPSLACPANQILSTICPDGEIPNYLSAAQFSDNCLLDLTISQSPAPGTTLGILFTPLAPSSGNVVPVTITLSDSNPANTVNCTFNVTLEDGQSPIPDVSPLPSITSRCGPTVIFAPTATDPCSATPLLYGTPSIAGIQLPGPPPRYLVQPGNYIVTWSYTDIDNNTTTQDQLIILLADVFPPVALCKPAFTLNLSPGGDASITLANIDNGSNDPDACGAITRSLSKTFFNCDDIGQNTIVLTVTDTSGNTATCSTVVTVRDVTAPSLPAIPADITIEACSTVPAPASLISSDACDADVAVVFTQTSNQDTIGVGKYNYTITRTWTFTDNSGNASTGTQRIVVRDTQVPVFGPFAPDTAVFFTGVGNQNCSAPVSVNMVPHVSDCATGPDLTITNDRNPAQGGNFSGALPVGETIIRFTATDITGNASTRDVVAIVLDDTPPTPACINGITTALDQAGFVILTPAQLNANSFDNCGGPLSFNVQRLGVSGTPPASTIQFDCSDADAVTQHPVRLTVIDSSGNAAACETWVIVQDNIRPEITFCPPARILDCAADDSPAVNGTATAIDNCPSNLTVTFFDTPIVSQSGANLGFNRTWVASDLSNNSATCVQNFTIIDTDPPVLSSLPANVTIDCGEDLPSIPGITATDNCSIPIDVVLTIDTTDFASGLCGKYAYTVRRTWTAGDEYGNNTVHTQTIVVQDTTKPVFNRPDTIRVFASNFVGVVSNCPYPVVINLADYLEDCADDADLTVTNNSPYGNGQFQAGGNFPLGTFTIIFTATDPCGNATVDSLVVVVTDDLTPTMVCIDQLIVALGSSGTATIQASDLDVASFDNCGIDSFQLSQSTFDCSDLGLNQVTLTAIDNAGNTNSCVVDISVVPGQLLVFGLTVTGTDETAFGLQNGTAQASAVGGSGSFSYQWSNGATTAAVSGLAAGTYTVTVMDNNSNCTQVGTVTIGAGQKITLYVGDAGGAWNETVKVPVSVDYFERILGFSFTLDVEDASVGVPVGVTDIHPALVANIQANIIGNKLVVLWDDLFGQPQTIPNGTLLFNLEVQLQTAPLGSFSPVNVTGDPVVIEFQKDVNNGVFSDIMINIVPGTVEITDDSAPVDLTIAGDIVLWRNSVPVKNVNVLLGGTLSATSIFNDSYQFSVPQGSNTIVSMDKFTAGSAGIESADLLLIERHIFGDILPQPYQWLAADVNDDKKVSLADRLRIQRVILGVDSLLPNGITWKFVPASYVFPPNSTMPFGPLTDPVPNSIASNNVDMDHLDDDFIAVRMGDVNGNSPVSLHDDAADDRFGPEAPLVIRIDDVRITPGMTLEVPVLADQFFDRAAYQFTLNVDPEVLELEEAVPAAVLPGLSMENFGMAYASKGMLTTNWVNREAQTLAAGDELFRLRFRAKAGARALSDVLHLSSDVTKAAAYTGEGTPTPVSLVFRNMGGSEQDDRGAFVLYQNQPNPFAGNTRIRFQLAKADHTVLRILDVSGREVYRTEKWCDPGMHEVILSARELNTPGVYWYELTSGADAARKKLVLID